MRFLADPAIQFVELYMDKYDAPAPLKITAEASAKNNAKQQEALRNEAKGDMQIITMIWK